MSKFSTNSWSALGQHLTQLGALVLAFLLISGCGSAQEPAPTEESTMAAQVEEVEPTTAPSSEAAADETNSEVLEVQFGINAQFDPFVFKDEQGQIVGFDIELINALSQVGNFEITYTDMPFEELLPKVETGELDSAISAITVTEERAQRVNFSDTYFRSGQAPVSYFNPGQGLAVRIDESTITGRDSLSAGVTVGVKADTTGAAFVMNETEAEVMTFPEAADALNALSEGAVDAVVVDIPVIVRFIQNNPDAGVRVTGGPLTDEEYAIAVNPARVDILDRLNGALAEIQRSGEYDQLFEKWFGSP